MATVNAQNVLATGLTAEGTEHENTVTAANLTDSAGDAILRRVSGSSAHIGDVYKLEARVRVNDSNSTDTLTLLFRFSDGTTTTSLYAPSAFDAADADWIHLDATCVVTAVATGATGYSMRCEGYALSITAGGTPIIVEVPAVAITWNGSSDLDFQVNADWSVAHADNEMAAVQVLMYKIGTAA